MVIFARTLRHSDSADWRPRDAGRGQGFYGAKGRGHAIDNVTFHLRFSTASLLWLESTVSSGPRDFRHSFVPLRYRGRLGLRWVGRPREYRW